MTTERKATLNIDGQAPVDFPIMSPTHGNDCVDIRTLGGKTGLFTYDSGFLSTASCKSKVTFIDGDKGELLYRGYPIEQLAENCNFLEVTYLLKNGELPNASQKSDFENTIKKHTMVHEQLSKFYSGFRRDAHPMAVMTGVVGALSAFYHDAMDFSDAEHRNVSFNRLVAKLPTIVAMAYKYSMGEPFMYPRNDLSYTANFMHMMFGTPCEKYEPNPVLVRALDRIFILHADHEQNCSTSTVRIVGSSHAGLFASISAGVSALWGPLHGGANQAVLEMLEAIQADGGDADKYMAKAKDKNDPFRLMGFGHRVYKNFDPRARIIKKAADEVLNSLGVDDPILDIAKKLEAAALVDEYFVSRKLYPNVDFYSGIIYRALGIPTDMFTVMFAIGRLPGWIAQWKEMRLNNEPIGRPRQVYTGYPLREFVPLEKR